GRESICIAGAAIRGTILLVETAPKVKRSCTVWIFADAEARVVLRNCPGQLADEVVMFGPGNSERANLLPSSHLSPLRLLPEQHLHKFGCLLEFFFERQELRAPSSGMYSGSRQFGFRPEIA